jgi:pimeloyl-ACP methyl ester carboxylesterase
MSITVIDDNIVHYEATGRGVPVIFMHGWLGSWRYWWPSMQVLSSQFRTFAFDLWGYGDSSKDFEKYSFKSYLELLDQFIDRLGITQPVTLIGHALGAAISTKYARLNADRVERLVNVALPVTGQSINSSLTNGRVSNFMDRYLHKSKSYSQLRQELAKTDLAAVSAVAEQLSFYDFTDDLLALKCPVLVIFGENDTVIRNSHDQYRIIWQENASRFVISLENSNHFPMLDQPAVFNRLIQDFVVGDGQQKITPKQYWQRRTR